jgi:predicted HicB family RNase H-like nuclease
MEEQNKRKYYTEARKRANEKYLSGLDLIHLRLPKGRKAEIQAAAAAVNESVNQYVTGAIDRRIESGS